MCVKVLKRNKISFFAKDDQSWREEYCDTILALAYGVCSNEDEVKVKRLTGLGIKPWLDLLVSFCVITGLKKTTVFGWLGKKKPELKQDNFIEAYNEACAIVSARLAGGMLDNVYKKENVETLMWWKFREKICLPKEQPQVNVNSTFSSNEVMERLKKALQ